MTSDLLDLDDIAADDALIESIRAGATRADLPDDDFAVDVLLAARDGAHAPAAEPSAAATRRRLLTSAITAHRRSIAVAVAAGIAVTSGVGAAVAGDPMAALKYVVDRGVEIGSRIGSPGGSSQANGGLGAPPQAIGYSTAPVRQGSAAAPLGDMRENTTVGFIRDSAYWLVPSPRGLEEYVDGANDSPGHDSIVATGVETSATGPGPKDSPTTRDPESTPTDADEETVETAESTPTDDADPSDGPTTTAIIPPTESDPTETVSPPPTESDPTETVSPPPTESDPTETASPPTESDPTETASPPTETTTPPPTDATSPPSAPAPSTSASPTESPTP